MIRLCKLHLKWANKNVNVQPAVLMVLVHADMTASHSCCRFIDCTFKLQISCSTKSQICSVRLRSGDTKLIVTMVELAIVYTKFWLFSVPVAAENKIHQTRRRFSNLLQSSVSELVLSAASVSFSWLTGVKHGVLSGLCIQGSSSA